MIPCPVWDEFHGLNSQFPPVLWHQIHAIYGKVDTEVLATEKFKKHCLSVREKKKTESWEDRPGMALSRLDKDEYEK